MNLAYVFIYMTEWGHKLMRAINKEELYDAIVASVRMFRPYQGEAYRGTRNQFPARQPRLESFSKFWKIANVRFGPHVETRQFISGEAFDVSSASIDEEEAEVIHVYR